MKINPVGDTTGLNCV